MERLNKAHAISAIVAASLAAMVSAVFLFDRFFGGDLTKPSQTNSTLDTEDAPDQPPYTTVPSESAQLAIPETSNSKQLNVPTEDTRTDVHKDENEKTVTPLPKLPVIAPSDKSPQLDAVNLIPDAPTAEPFQLGKSTPESPVVVPNVKLFEKVQNFPCGAAEVFQFSVARQGTDAANSIYVIEPKQSGRIDAGAPFAISNNCIVTLQRTGKASRFFGEFSIARTTPYETE